MIITRSVEELFSLDLQLGACGESCWYQGKGRRADTYEAVDRCSDPGLFIKNPVNSGCMVIDHTLISMQNYLEMVAMVDPGLWSDKNTFHADQLIINLHFRDKISLIGAKYNYRPTNAGEILTKEGTGFEDAKIIHYFRQYKPWNFKEVFELTQHDMVHLRAFRLWYHWFVDLLKHNHVQQKIQLLRNNGPARS
jgi:lipopolysaccharide biosynthesis glycosyltransferase